MENSNDTWSFDDIRNNASSWSLEGDAKLLEIMQNISKKIEERSVQTTTNLNKMMCDLDRTKVVLGNTTNKLMSLQHTQFVENRVYDDDDEIVGNVPVELPSTANEEKITLVEALQSVLDSGMKVMDKYYERVSFELSDDSDDEPDKTDHQSVMFRPKDPYKNRPLPYTIGSKDWQDKWHIGLVESASDSELEENGLEKAETSSSSSSSDSLSSRAATSISDSDGGSVWGVKALPMKPEATDIFEDENVSPPAVGKPIQAPFDIHAQLTKELSSKMQQENVPTNVPSGSAAKSIFMPQRQDQQQVSRVSANLFDDEPPELDEPPSYEKKIEKQKPINLFVDDEDDDDDSFSITNANKPKPEPNKSTITKSINLFDDDNFDDDALFSSLAKPNKAGDSNNNREALFEDSLASKQPARIEGKTSILSTQPPKSNLFVNIFDDEPPDDDFDFLPKTKSTKANISINKEIEKPLLEPKQEEEIPKTPVNVPNKVDLFDDHDEEDDFSKLLAKTKKDAKPTSKPAISTASKSVFDDFDGDDDFLAKSSSKSSKNDSDSQDATSSDSFTAPPKPKAAVASISTPTMSKNLFDDVDNDKEDLFGSSASTFKKESSLSFAPSKPLESNTSSSLSKSLFDDENDDLFGGISEPSQPAKPQFSTESKPTPSILSKNLFDDDDNDEDNNFFGKVASAVSKNLSLDSKEAYSPPKIIAKTEATGVYYDDFSETISASQRNIPKKEIKSSENCVKEDSASKGADSEDLNESTKSVSELRKTLENESSKNKSPEKTNTESVKPKKLNIASIHINVSALLPGAKPAKQNKERTPDEVDKEQGPTNSIPTTIKAVAVDNADDSGRLTNLTKSRVKIPTRRQSTRRGRLQHYERSLETENIPQEKEEENLGKTPPADERGGGRVDTCTDKPNHFIYEEQKPVEQEKREPEPELLPPNDSGVDSIENKSEDFKEQKESEVLFSEQEDEIDDSSTPVKPVSDLEPQQIESNKRDITATLFGDENEEEDDDWLTSALLSNKSIDSGDKKDITVPTEPESVKESLTKPLQTPAINTYISEGPPPLPTAMSSSGLFDDESDESWSPPAARKSSEKSADIFAFSSDKPPPLPTADTSKLFSEDDDGSGDDLFGTKKPLNEKTEKLQDVEINTADAKLETKLDKPKVEEVPSAHPKKIDPFFDDDEDNEEDLFEKPPPLLEPKMTKAADTSKAKTKISSSLFGDESSDDDDLFGATKKTTITKSTETSTKSKLFSDDEEDDLFGPQSKPIKPKSTSVNSGQSRTQKMKPSSSATNDPLADLLK